MPDDVTIDPGSARGYRRDPAAQDSFDQAAAALLASDGWPDPAKNGERTLVADLALEGGGVKGIGLVGAILVLSEAGYTFRCVAGTSAGSIGAALITAITKAGRPMTDLRSYLTGLDFTKFMPEGKIHHFLDHVGGKAGTLAADAAILAQRMGLYSGDYLAEWLTPILHGDLGVRNFGDLKLTVQEDPGMSVAPGREYRLVVHTSDITRGQLVHLPWDFPLYGYDDLDTHDIVGAVRASMSIPFFFEPVTFEARPADVEIPSPDGQTIMQHYDGGTVTWVDGGMLRNFPISAFDRVDGAPPRWPTIGIKLSSLQRTFPATQACESSIAVGIRCLHTLLNEWDAYEVDEATAARTIFVDNGGLTATQFQLSQAQQDMLFLNGVRAATAFITEMAEAKRVPRTAEEALALADVRRSSRVPRP
jgi:NTE family protein